MRMYLSSYLIGPAADELVKLCRGRRVLICVNAGDGFTDRERWSRAVSRQVRDLSALGFVYDFLDLRAFFRDSDALVEKLRWADLVWVIGGNTFVLKRALEQSGADILLRDMIIRDELVYGGFSAALPIVTPTLRGLELVDDSHIDVPEGYASAFSWDGWGLVPYSLVAHYRSKHPESEAVDAIVEYFVRNDMPYRALRDGEALVVDGTRDQVVGQPTELWLPARL